MPEHAFFFDLIVQRLQFGLFCLDLLGLLVGDGDGFRAGRQRHNDFHGANGDAVAVVEISRADVAAVDGDGLHRSQFA